MSLTSATVLFILPIFFGFALYTIHDSMASPLTDQSARQRIRVYSVGLFLFLFVPLAFLATIAVATLQTDRSTICSGNLPCLEYTMTLFDYIELYVIIGLYALIPSSLLYIFIGIFHRFISDSPISKQKRKNDESVE